MSSCYITLSYHIISHVFLFYLFCWFDLHSILFYWIRFTILVSILSHINEWFVSISPSVRLSVCPSVCLFICMNKFIVFSSLLFLYSFFSRFLLFSFSFLFLFSWTSSSHTHTRTHTDTHIHMNICSFLWLVHITSKGCKWRIVFYLI